MNYFELQFLILAWTEPSSSAKYKNFWINLLFEWQTLVAALVAGVPAALGAYLLYKQIRSQHAENERARTKEEVSARIRLVYALSALTSYYKACIGPIMESKYQSLEMPTTALETLMSSAPVLNKEVFEHIQKLIMNLQIFSAVYPSKTGQMNVEVQDRVLISLAKLHKATNEIYPYARFHTEVLSSSVETPEELSLSLHGLVATADDRPDPAEDEKIIKRALRPKSKRRTSTTVPPIDID